jgi:SAM-dependent methyltransferase
MAQPTARTTTKARLVGFYSLALIIALTPEFTSAARRRSGPCASALGSVLDIHSWSDFPVEESVSLKSRTRLDVLRPHPALELLVHPGYIKIGAVYGKSDRRSSNLHTSESKWDRSPLFLLAIYPSSSSIYWFRDPLLFTRQPKYWNLAKATAQFFLSQHRPDIHMAGATTRILDQPVVLLKLDGVFPPKSTYADQLVENALPRLQGASRILVLGSGSGFDTLAIAQTSVADIVAADIDERAVLATRLNLSSFGFPQVRVVQSDLFSNVEGRFDRIVFNAPRPISFEIELARDPKLSTREFREFAEETPARISHYDIDAKIFDRFLAEAPAHLAPGGEILLMSDSLIRYLVPKSWKLKKLSHDFAWGREDLETFAIFSLSLKNPEPPFQ